MGANSFLEFTPDEMGDKNENKTVTSPERVPVHFKVSTFLDFMLFMNIM